MVLGRIAARAGLPLAGAAARARSITPPPILFLMAVVFVVFALPVLLGYSLLPQYVTPSVLPSGLASQPPRFPSGALTIDPTASLQMLPWNKLVGDSLRSGHLPLWNPYSLTGLPLLANIQSAALFPIQLLQDLTPSSWWSYVYILRFSVAGLFTFLFLRRVGLEGFPSATGAVFFLLAGPTILYFRLEPVFNSTVMLPVVLYLVERLCREPSRASLTFASFAFACQLLSGQPEVTTLNVLFLVSYSAFRSWQRASAGAPWSGAWMLLAPYPVGVLLAMPFLLPIGEYVIWTGQAGREAFGRVFLNPVTAVLQIAPYLLGRVHEHVTPEAQLVFSWNLISGYVGIVATYLAVLAALSKTRRRFSGLCGFATITALTVLAKFYGLPPAQWLAYLPLLNMFWFTRYSGAVLALSVAILAAIGAQAFTASEDVTARKRALLVTAVLWVLLLWPAVGLMAVPPGGRALAALAPVIVPSCLLVLIAFFALRSAGGRDALIMPVLVTTELMILAPSGLPGTEEVLRVVSVGLLATVPFWISRRAWYPAAVVGAGALAGVIVSQAGVSGSPPDEVGLPRATALFAEPRFVEFLKRAQSRDHGRTYSLDGFLNGNYPAAFGIYGLNACEGLLPMNLRAFASKYLDPGVNPAYFDGVSPFRSAGSAREALRLYRRYYDFIGIRFIVGSPREHLAAGSPRSLPAQKQNVAVGFAPGDRFTWKVRLERDGLSGIRVLTGTFDRHNRGTIVLRIKNSRGRTLARSRVRAADVANNEYTEFRFSPVGLTAGTDLTLEWEYVGGRAGDAVAFWCEPDMDTSYALQGSSQYARVLPYVIQVSDDGLMLVYEGEAWIWENPAAFPRAFVVPSVKVARSTTEALEMLASMDLRKEAVITSARDDLTLIAGPAKPAKLRVTRMEPGTVALSLEGTRQGLLVMTDTYYPGWVVTVDGERRPLYEADGAFRGVFLRDGDREVVFEYRPEPFRIGLMISVLTTLVCVAPRRRARIR